METPDHLARAGELEEPDLLPEAGVAVPASVAPCSAEVPVAEQIREHWFSAAKQAPPDDAIAN